MAIHTPDDRPSITRYPSYHPSVSPSSAACSRLDQSGSTTLQAGTDPATTRRREPALLPSPALGNKRSATTATRPRYPPIRLRTGAGHDS